MVTARCHRRCWLKKWDELHKPTATKPTVNAATATQDVTTDTVLATLPAGAAHHGGGYFFVPNVSMLAIDARHFVPVVAELENLSADFSTLQKGAMVTFQIDGGANILLAPGRGAPPCAIKVYEWTQDCATVHKEAAVQLSALAALQLGFLGGMSAEVEVAISPYARGNIISESYMIKHFGVYVDKERMVLYRSDTREVVGDVYEVNGLYYADVLMGVGGPAIPRRVPMMAAAMGLREIKVTPSVATIAGGDKKIVRIDPKAAAKFERDVKAGVGRDPAPGTKEYAAKLLADVERRWQENVLRDERRARRNPDDVDKPPVRDLQVQDELTSIFGDVKAAIDQLPETAAKEELARECPSCWCGAVKARPRPPSTPP